MRGLAIGRRQAHELVMRRDVRFDYRLGGGHGSTDAAPEALYWAGVARYKATGDAAALSDTAGQFRQRYQESSWAKKASVWNPT